MSLLSYALIALLKFSGSYKFPNIVITDADVMDSQCVPSRDIAVYSPRCIENDVVISVNINRVTIRDRFMIECMWAL